MAKTSAQRQAALRAHRLEQGLKQIGGFAHIHQLGDLMVLFQRLSRDPDLQVGPLRNTRTGKLESLNQ